jgi:hypothetical protein
LKSGAAGREGEDGGLLGLDGHRGTKEEPGGSGGESYETRIRSHVVLLCSQCSSGADDAVDTLTAGDERNYGVFIYAWSPGRVF